MPKERHSEVKISGAYIMKDNRNAAEKEITAGHELVNITATANSLTTSVNPGKEGLVPLIGHRISLKGMNIAEDDGGLFNIKWYEKTNIAYNALEADKWTDLYVSNHDALLFRELGDSIEDFPLAARGASRSLEFIILAAMNTGDSFFMNAAQVTNGNTGTLTIYHCGIINSDAAEDFSAYVWRNLQGTSNAFALPDGVTIADCFKEFSTDKVYRREYE